jgi:hypothetical protein
MAGSEQRSSISLISVPALHSKSLFTHHDINKEILSCFLEKQSIVLQRAVKKMGAGRVHPRTLIK